MTAFGPGCDTSRVYDQSVIGSHVLVRTRQENTDEIRQARFAVKWVQDDLRLDLGTSYVEDEFNLQGSNTFTNNFWQAYGGYGAPSRPHLRCARAGEPVFRARSVPRASSRASRARGSLPSGGLQKYNPYALYGLLQGLGDPWTKQINGFNYPGPLQNPTNADADAGELAGPVRGGRPDHPALCDYHGSLDAGARSGQRAGHRGEDPGRCSCGPASRRRDQPDAVPFQRGCSRRANQRSPPGGIGRLPILLTVSPADPTLLTTTFSASTADHHEEQLQLPASEPGHEAGADSGWHLRFDASRTLTRPAINFLTPVLNVGRCRASVRSRRTAAIRRLKPYLSDNFDFAVEWYYQANSYASINAFTKDVTNFIVQGTQRQTVNNVIDPSTGQPAIYTVSQRVNGPDARVHGFELAWQHVFGDTGFGFNANATIVDSNRPYDRTDISQSGFAITGLADSANLVAFYDKHDIEVRVAANWRDEYLLQFGQNQNNSAFGAEPTYVNSSLQIDLSSSYQITPAAERVLRGVERHERGTEHARSLR